MKDYSVENLTCKNKKTQDAKKSIHHYLEQVKMHFDLTEDEIINLLENILNSQKKNNSTKKWWHFW